MNIGDPWPDLFEAESEVLTMQTELPLSFPRSSGQLLLVVDHAA